jgi:hypothetical protein
LWGAPLAGVTVTYTHNTQHGARNQELPENIHIAATKMKQNAKGKKENNTKHIILFFLTRIKLF